MIMMKDLLRVLMAMILVAVLVAALSAVDYAVADEMPEPGLTNGIDAGATTDPPDAEGSPNKTGPLFPFVYDDNLLSNIFYWSLYI